jgi:predicted HTH transcriptional regulator
MTLLDRKPLDQIDKADIQQLIDDEVQESKTIEYKSEIIGNKDEQKKELLAYVSSFANASGGHLIIGICAEKGIPKQISGLQIADIDREISRLENMTRDGIEPRISGLNIHSVRIDSLFIIIIFIPQSFALPHIVKYKNHNKFYSRNSNGKCLLDVGEIRNLFNVSETAIERVRFFRTERLSMIVSGQTPIQLEHYPKLVLHVIPPHHI